jgi:putative ABC transport system substrate-binding protein
MQSVVTRRSEQGALAGWLKRRRAVLAIALLGAAPCVALGQPSAKPRRIGFLGTGSAAGMAEWLDAFRDELRELGYVEGRNLAIEYRWADGRYDKAPQLAAELVRAKVEVLVTHGTPGTRAAKQATSTTPIVMATAGDAVLVGLVASIARPGGNVTGSTFFNPELAAKRLEYAKDVLPRISTVALLENPDNPAMGPVHAAMQPVARELRIELLPFPVRSPEELKAAIPAMAARRAGAAIVLEDGMLNTQLGLIAELATAARLPAIGQPELADHGGMIAYGVRFDEMYRRAAVFVDKILKGARPGDLPVERATRFELVVNLRAAKTLGITIPQTFLVRADRLIE